MKKCNGQCNQIKKLSDFYKKGKNSYRHICKICYGIKEKIRRDSIVKVIKTNEEKEIERNKAKKRIKEYEKQWHFNNKENRAKQARDKYNNPNSLFKIKANLRTRFNNAIKRGQKAGSAINDLGCSIEEFKVYIESKFEPWMNWDNYGNYDKDKDTWQFDHIVALANIDLTNREEFLKAAHFSNYQPLLVLDNIKKSNK